MTTGPATAWKWSVPKRLPISLAKVHQGRRHAWQQLSGSGTVLSVSAGAADEVFVIKSDDHLWGHKLTGFSLLSAGNVQSISATQTADGHGEVFGVLSDSSLWENNPKFAGDHWMNLIPSGVLAVAAPLRR